MEDAHIVSEWRQIAARLRRRLPGLHPPHRRISLLIALGLAACEEGFRGYPSFNEVTTEWVSAQGFTINVRPGGRYTFCDGAACFTDEYVRTGEGDSPSIVLKRLGSHREAARFLFVLEVVGRRDQVRPDLNFFITGGMAPVRLCDNDPCVIFGSPSRRRNNVVFRRRGDL